MYTPYFSRIHSSICIMLYVGSIPALQAREGNVSRAESLDYPKKAYGAPYPRAQRHAVIYHKTKFKSLGENAMLVNPPIRSGVIYFKTVLTMYENCVGTGLHSYVCTFRQILQVAGGDSRPYSGLVL